MFAYAISNFGVSQDCLTVIDYAGYSINNYENTNESACSIKSFVQDKSSEDINVIVYSSYPFTAYLDPILGVEKTTASTKEQIEFENEYYFVIINKYLDIEQKQLIDVEIFMNLPDGLFEIDLFGSEVIETSLANYIDELAEINEYAKNESKIIDKMNYPAASRRGITLC